MTKPLWIFHTQWNSAWPRGNSDITFDQDQAFINGLGGRKYMAGVSPWFFAVSYRYFCYLRFHS